MTTLYEAEYKYKDTPNENHHAYVVTYTQDDALGRFFAEQEDYSGEEYATLDEILSYEFGLKDDDICFYCDMTGRENVAKALEEDHDLDIISIQKIKEEKEETYEILTRRQG